MAVVKEAPPSPSPQVFIQSRISLSCMGAPLPPADICILFYSPLGFSCEERGDKDRSARYDQE